MMDPFPDELEIDSAQEFPLSSVESHQQLLDDYDESYDSREIDEEVEFRCPTCKFGFLKAEMGKCVGCTISAELTVYDNHCHRCKKAKHDWCECPCQKAATKAGVSSSQKRKASSQKRAAAETTQQNPENVHNPL